MRLCIPILISWLLACGSSSKSEDSGVDSGGVGSADDTPAPDDAVDLEPIPYESEPLFDVTGGPYDLAVHDDGRVFCTVQESRLMVWDAAVGWVEEVSDDLGPIFSIALVDDAVYFTTSTHRQSGTLSRLVDGEVEVLATAAGSTIFREPTDLAMAPDGSWAVADKTLETLIGVSPDGEAWLIASPGPLSTLAFQGNTLYFGGESGTWSMKWPDGDPTAVDARSTNGLHVWDGKVWGTNTASRVYEIGGTLSIPVEGVRVPGRLAGSDTLYMSDWGLADVWAIEG